MMDTKLGAVCEHGCLARQCYTCELEEEVTALRAMVVEQLASFREADIARTEAEAECQRLREQHFRDATLIVGYEQNEPPIVRGALDAQAAAEKELFALRHVNEMLQAEVNVLRGVECEADGDGPCGVCVKCLRAGWLPELTRLREDLALALGAKNRGPQ